MANLGASTVIDLEGNTGAGGGVDGSGTGGSGGGVTGGGGGNKHVDDCCGGGGGHCHGQQKKISLDVMEEGKEVEFLFEAVKQG